MRRVFASIVLLVASCGESPATDDAGRDATTADSSLTAPDAFAPASDAVVLADHICSGLAVPLDLECVTQNARLASACAGEGTYVFDGDACQRAEGVECTGERGAFDTLEDCAVTCARAGHCTVIWVDGLTREPQTCDEVRENFRCETISVLGGTDIPDDCNVWAPFGRHARGGPRVPGNTPDALLMLFSASLAPPYGAYCQVNP